MLNNISISASDTQQSGAINYTKWTASERVATSIVSSDEMYMIVVATNTRKAAPVTKSEVLVYIPINPRIVESRYSTRERVGDSNDDEHATQQRPRIWPSPK